jgi:hypothetical protein
VRFHLLKIQTRPLDFFAVEAVQLFFDPREDARRAAGADQLDFAGFSFFSAGSSCGRTSSCRKFFSQSRQALNSPRVGGSLCGNFSISRTVPSGKLCAKCVFSRLAQNEFRAAAADVQQQQRLPGQFRVGGHALKRPSGLRAPEMISTFSRTRASMAVKSSGSPRRARRWWR